jgi:hypothetical protein
MQITPSVSRVIRVPFRLLPVGCPPIYPNIPTSSAVGLLGGFAFGFAVGYSQGDRTIVIPLAEGIET